jgi:RNA polymerase sigma-70 factor (ECF subfamily)
VTEEEFQAVYERTAGPLRRYLVRACGDSATADDLLQETYYRYLGLDPGPRATAPEKPLLFRMATHLVYDHFRRFRREERHLRNTLVTTTTGSSDAVTEDVARVFRDLRPREQSLLWLAYVEGLTHAEIAVALDLAPASVRVLLFRARSDFARRLRSRGLHGE